MVKRSIEQEIRNKNFGFRNGKFEKNAVVKNQGTKQRGQRILGDCWQWEANGQCSKGDNCSFRHDINKRAKMTQPNPSPSSFMQQNERNASRNRSPWGRSPSGRMSRWPCKDYLKGTCNNSFCEKWHPPEWLFYKTKSGCRFGKSALMHIARLMHGPAKALKIMMTKVQWPCWRSMELYDRTRKPVVCRDTRHEHHGPVVCNSSNTRQLGCVFQDMKPPKSILRKSSDMQKTIQRVKFTKTVARHAKNRDQNPSLGMICPGETHRRNPNAPKFEDRSQEETEWQERCAREAAWKLAKSVLNLQEQNKATFFSPSENRCLPASTLKPEERELLWTPERRCIWSAKWTWMMLKWILWRNRAVLR